MFPELYFSTMIHIIEENGLKRVGRNQFEQAAFCFQCAKAQTVAWGVQQDNVVVGWNDFGKNAEKALDPREVLG